MALVYVGGTGGAGNTDGYTVSLSGTLVGGVGSSPEPGDLVIVSSGFNSASVKTPHANATGNISGAYVAAHANLIADYNADANFGTFYQLQGATVDTSIAINRPTTNTYGGSTTVHVWRGVDSTNPMDVTPTSTFGIGSAWPNPPSITPISSGAVIVACGYGAQSTNTAALLVIPSGMGNGVSLRSSGNTTEGCCFIASIEWTSGAYDPARCTVTTGPADYATAGWCASTLALRPQQAIRKNGLFFGSNF